MWKPSEPVIEKRSDRFRPTHCPWPACPAHLPPENGKYPYTRKGYRPPTRSSHRRLPRFQCGVCRRTFSQSAFTPEYYLKRPELMLRIANLLVSGCAHRQIARELGCAPSTVTRMSVRLGRHALRFLDRSLKRLAPIDEPVVLDHFETFVRSQQERLGIATVSGQNSWFVYAIDGASYLRMKGRSRRKRAVKRKLEPPPPRAVTRSTRKTLEKLARHVRGTLDLVSDDHPAYRSAVRVLTSGRGGSTRIRHTIHRNPDRSSSQESENAKLRDAAMFANDLLHKLLRHCQAHHRRETIAFGRKEANVVGRAALFAVWRNMIKLVTERRPTYDTPATRLELTARQWNWRDVFAERLFAAHLG